MHTHGIKQNHLDQMFTKFMATKITSAHGSKYYVSQNLGTLADLILSSNVYYQQSQQPLEETLTIIHSTLPFKNLEDLGTHTTKLFKFKSNASSSVSNSGTLDDSCVLYCFTAMWTKCERNIYARKHVNCECFCFSRYTHSLKKRHINEGYEYGGRRNLKYCLQHGVQMHKQQELKVSVSRV